MKRRLSLLLIAVLLTGCGRGIGIGPEFSTPAAAAAVTVAPFTPSLPPITPSNTPTSVSLGLPYPDAPDYQIDYDPRQWQPNSAPAYLTNPVLLVHTQLSGCQIEMVFTVGFEGEAFIPQVQDQLIGGRAWQALEGLNFFTVVDDPHFPGLRLIGFENEACREAQFEVLATLEKVRDDKPANPVNTQAVLNILAPTLESLTPPAVLATTPTPGPVGLSSPAAGSSFATCPGAISPRLKVGRYARALTFLNIRSTPEREIENVIGLVQAETTVAVVDGPVCSNDGAVTFWKISYTEGITSTLTGWVAEGQAGEYFLEPK